MKRPVLFRHLEIDPEKTTGSDCLPRISESKRDINTRASQFQQIYLNVSIDLLTKETMSRVFIHIIEIKVQIISREDLYHANNYGSLSTIF